ncbi:hypothetical protein C1N61_28360 (plasmid) [Priestia aryabhattai]
MLRSFYQGIAGMKAMSDGLSVAGNNIANARTNGYKTKQALFEDMYYQEMKAATSTSDKYAGTNAIALGNGSKMKGVAIDQGQGSLNSTGRTTDLAISGNGYFVVGDSNGDDRYYTRDGAFELSSDNKLVSSGGQYVMGWNVDSLTGKVNTGAAVTPIEINMNTISKASETSSAKVGGNLSANSEVGNVVGMQIPTYDSLGSRHDIDMNFIKTSSTPSKYAYIASPAKDFVKSASIDQVAFQPSLNIAGLVQKGNYSIATAASATPGSVDITLKDPSGTTILTKTVTDTDQTVSLDDGTNQWFTVEYKKGGAPSTANFQVGEVGTLEYDAYGKLVTMSGSGVNGTAQIDFIPQTTGKAMSVNVDLTSLSGVAADDITSVSDSDGFPAAILKGYSIGDRGVISGYFSDGSVKQIGQVAVATFANPSGLSVEGENLFATSASSGDPEIGVSGLGDKGVIKSGSLEGSNVDTSKELTELMFYQKAYTANSKTITIADQILNVAIGLIR